MNGFFSMVLVFFASMIPFIEAPVAASVPILLGMPFFPVVMSAFEGNFLSLFVTIWFGYRVKGVIERRKANKNSNDSSQEGFVSKRQKRAKGLWEKFGMPGLSIAGMGYIGGHITALAACAFTENRSRVTLWMAISIFIWGGALGIVAYLGYDFVSDHPWLSFL